MPANNTTSLELTDKAVYPGEEVLKRVLGRSYSAYCVLLELYSRNGMQHDIPGQT